MEASNTNRDGKSNWERHLLTYLKQNFSKKHNLWRLWGFLVALVIVLVPSLTCNLMIRNNTWPWSGVVYNDGITFNWLENRTVLVYTIQSLICVIIFFGIIFTDKWYYSLLLSMAFVGGLFNIIDRATQSPPNPNTVIDYLDTSFIFNTISNFPDVFILTGIISFTVLYVTMSVITITKEKRRITKSKDNNPTHEKNHS